jgi:hypothetical protein
MGCCEHVLADPEPAGGDASGSAGDGSASSGGRAGTHDAWHLQRMAAAWGVTLPPLEQPQRSASGACGHAHSEGGEHTHVHRHASHATCGGGGAKLPLTLVSGPAARRAALLSHLALPPTSEPQHQGQGEGQHAQGAQRIAVIVADPACLNIDSDLRQAAGGAEVCCLC